ncbi:hypothetical protein MMC21_000604 [Puttea exsequens]|nr:hypothetical protein [Puttea exsequens]
MSESREDAEAFRSAMRGGTPEIPSNDTPMSTNSATVTKDAPIPAPSSSILLISSTNRILLLHRVQTSTAFASAHVFPGGHVDPQDGDLPPVDDVRRHEDSKAYRLAAIRECFEESGLLLARKASSSELVELSEMEKEEGRKNVHAGEVSFAQWVQQRGGIPDVEGLVPFTRWLTPRNLPKRYTTQMYLYFLPIDDRASSKTEQKRMHIPTPDGGIEHTAAQFLYPREWLDMTLTDEIVLFPPQFFLLALIADYLIEQVADQDELGSKEMHEQRRRLMHFVETDGEPPWGEKCISPNPIKRIKGKYMIMGMSDPGPELQGTGRRGDDERVLRVELTREAKRGRPRPKPTKVLWRKDMMAKIESSSL